MRAMSGGEAFVAEQYLFFSAENWLAGIAYPLYGKYSHESWLAALNIASEQSGAVSFSAIGAQLPPSLAPSIVERDRFYILSASAEIPARLKNSVKRAGSLLTVTESTEFTAEHRRLWTEFLENNRAGMSDRVAELYARTPQALKLAGSTLRFLDARDGEGRLAASLLLDFSPQHFTSYVIGAHSRKNYVPHSTDLLFAAMLEKSRNRGKRYIHLGLGVNDGILRFKLKWGARPYLPYVLAQWQGKRKITNHYEKENVGRALASAILRAPAGSARQILGDSSTRKPFAMLWQVEKNGNVSWVGGTAHFFCHSFEYSFKKLFRNVDKVIFEGPLDPEFMAKVDEAGKKRLPGTPRLLDLLTKTEVEKLERTVLGPRGPLAQKLGLQSRVNVDVRWLLANASPWHAFFTLWTTFLERHGWHESVDMEAWRLAQEMGREVIGMETLEEQLESLGSLPVERVARFFRACNTWRARAARNMHAYLAGDLEKMMGSSAEFPTRTEHVVGRRDQRFRERMRPYLLAGRCAVFVGSAHMVNLRHMLAEDGFSVRQAPFGLWPRIHLQWRKFSRPDEKVAW